MAKTKDNPSQLKETKAKELKDKETKEKEPRGKSNLVGRVKKVIKKSRRKLGEEKFEKELQRTIEFLAQLRAKLDNSHDAKASDKSSAKVGGKKPAPGAGKKVEQDARNSPAAGLRLAERRRDDDGESEDQVKAMTASS